MTEPPPGPFDPPNWPPPEPPSRSPRPPSHRPEPARGGEIVAGMAIAVFIGVLVLYCGAPFSGMGASSRVIAVGQLLLLVGCVAAGVVFFRRYDRGLGLGLIIGAALMALCGPLGGLGGCVSVFGG